MTFPAQNPAPEPVRPAEPIAPPPRPRGGWLNVLLALAFVVAVGGVAFAAGRVTASPGSAAGNRPGQIVLPGGSFSPDSSFRPGQGVVAGGAGLTLEGTVTAVDEDSITLELESGDSVEVSIDGETNYHERTEADAADVSPGSEVLIELDGPVTRSGEGNSSFGSATDVTVTE